MDIFILFLRTENLYEKILNYRRELFYRNTNLSFESIFGSKKSWSSKCCKFIQHKNVLTLLIIFSLQSLHFLLCFISVEIRSWLWLCYHENIHNFVIYLWAGIFQDSMGDRNRGVIGLSYRPARLHRPAEFIPWNRFLGSRNV